jgi:hypothetical protein
VTDVLLLELIAIDRFHRSLEFPFVNGHLRDRGLNTRWLRLGLTANWKTLAATAHEDIAKSIFEAVNTTGARRVLFNLFPGEIVAARLTGVGSKVSVAVLGSAAAADCGDWPRIPATTAALAEFCALAPLPKEALADLFDDVTPDFAWEPLNELAASAPSLPSLICGDECLYRRRLDKNPHFDGVDLTTCVRRDGCAFCVRPSEQQSWRHDSLTLARRQLTALAATHPPAQRLRIRPIGAPLLTQIEGLADLLIELAFPAADFLFDTRADTLIAARPALESALRRLANTGHRLHIALIGIESFVDRELGRFNKGTTWRDNLAAVRTLYELEQAFPHHFGFREHGGLSLLLYSPWTTPEDLALNLAVVATCELGELCGKLYTSRLRLYPTLPLTALARGDGLLTDTYDDPALDTARRNFYPDEMPWRFVHPQLEAVSRIFLRLELPDADAITVELSQLRERLPAASSHMSLARALVDAAIQEPELREPSALLNAAAPLLVSLAPCAPPDSFSPAFSLRPPAVGATISEISADVRLSHVRQVAAVRAGIKAVARIEPAAFPSEPARRWIEACVPVTRAWTNPDGLPELFLGRDEESITRAIVATETQRRGANEEAHRRATVEVGILLGYPSCCIDAYASHTWRVQANHTWMYLLLRLATPGAVSPLLGPYAQLFEHVPCALDCPASLDIAARMLLALTEILEPGPMETLRAELRRPCLMLVDAQDQAVELLLDGDPVGRCRYRAGARRGGSPLVDRVCEGDELIIEEQHLLVLRQGRVHAALGGRAFIWWHEAMVQRDFWQALVDVQRLASRSSVHPDGVLAATASTPSPLPIHLRQDRLASLVAAALQQAPTDFAGFQVRAVNQSHHHRVCVVLGRGDETIRLLVSPNSQAPRAFVRVGAIAVMTEREELLDTPHKLDAVHALARALGQRLRQAELV